MQSLADIKQLWSEGALGLWLAESDFFSTEQLKANNLGNLGFPRDWPAVYNQSKALKALIGKRGRCASKHVSTIGKPTAEQLSAVKGLALQPVQSFANATLVEKSLGLRVVQGWAVFEHLDMPTSVAFVAERYWWNAFPDGQWVDFTPHPENWPELILAEAVDIVSMEPNSLCAARKSLACHLLQQRFPKIFVSVFSARLDNSKDASCQYEIEGLKAELLAATRDADDACERFRALESEAAFLRQKLGGEIAFGCYSAPSEREEILIGGLVRIQGLKDSPGLNGQSAEVIQWDEKRSRWKVRLNTGETRAILPANLGMVDKPNSDPDLSTFGVEVIGELRQGIEYNLWPFVYSGFIRVRVPDRLIQRLNAQFDILYGNALSPSHSPFLQAEMKNGKQITILEPDDEYVQLLLDCSYRLLNATLRDDAFGMTCKLDTVWTVHQLEGDYNPVHFHTNPSSHFGFSSFLHLILPSQLCSAQQRLPRNEPNSHHDGVTSFMWKTDSPMAKENLELPGTIECDLAEGYLYVFPQWLQHHVWPFYGPGERRTVAANVALLTSDRKAQPSHVTADPGDPRGGVRIWQYS